MFTVKCFQSCVLLSQSCLIQEHHKIIILNVMWTFFNHHFHNRCKGYSRLILGLPFFHIKSFFILSISRIGEIGIIFTNARCIIFDFARFFLKTVVLPAIDKFGILQNLKSFSIYKNRFIKFSWFSKYLSYE